MELNRKTYINTDLYPSNELFPSGLLYPGTSVDISNIVSGSLRLSELIATDNLKFGQCCSNMFECEIYGIDDITNQYISVYQEDNGKTIPIFNGYIDSCKQDQSGTYRDIVAYDVMYYRGKDNVATWWGEYWANKDFSTLRDIRISLLDFMGLKYENKALPNDNLTIKKNVDIKSVAFVDMLGMICELQGCFPNVSRQGIIEFITLDSKSAKPIAEYEGNNSDFQSYQTKNYTGVQIFGSSGDLKETIGDYTNSYSIRENIFTYDKTNEELQSLGQTILDSIKNITFTPSSVKMIVSDFDYKLGDYVSTDKGSFYITQNEFSGIQFVEQTMTANGSETVAEVTKPVDTRMIVLNEKSNVFERTLEETRSEIKDVNANLSSEIKQTVDSLTTKIEDEDKKLQSNIEQTATDIRTEITDGDKAVSSEIYQTVDSISLNVNNKDTTAGITISLPQADGTSKDLEGTIDMTGLVSFTDLKGTGTTEINGANIQTGTVNCDTLNGGKIKGQTIEGGSITGSTINADSTFSMLFNDKFDNSTYYSPVFTTKVVQSGPVVKYNEIDVGDAKGEQLHAMNFNCRAVFDNYPVTFNKPINCEGVRCSVLTTTGMIETGSDVIINGVLSVFRGYITSAGDIASDASITAKGNMTCTRFISTEAVDAKTTSAPNCYIDTAGAFYKTSNTSTIRHKKDVTTELKEELNPQGLYDVDVVQFKYKDEWQPSVNDCRYDKDLIGFIAEDVYKKFPMGADTHEENGEVVVDGWNEQYIIPAMLKLIQEQHNEIEKLKKDVKELKKCYNNNGKDVL